MKFPKNRIFQFFIKKITPKAVQERLHVLQLSRIKTKELFLWYSETLCAPPAPHFVKQGLLLRHGIKDCTWIETGTHVGVTTKLLSSRFRHVHTIEPSEDFLSVARAHIGTANNVTYYHGTSEKCFNSACLAAGNGDVCFWLDGHWSAGNTFRGSADTPIIHELTVIQEFLSSYASVVVLIDDIRCSHSDPNNYPSLDFYVEWANANKLNWIIEHDSFIAKTKTLPVYP